MKGVAIRREWIFVALLFTGLIVFSPGLYDRYVPVRSMVLFFSLGIILFASVKDAFCVNRYAFLLLLLFLVEIISAMWSYSVANAIKYAFLSLLSFLVFLIFAQENSGFNFRLLIRLNALLVSTSMMMGLYQLISNGWDPYGILGLSSYKNLFAGLLMLSIPVTVISIKNAKHALGRNLMKLILVFSILFMLVLQSRSGYLALLLFFLLLLIFGIRHAYLKNWNPLLGGIIKQYGIVVICVLLGSGLYLVFVQGETREDFADKINMIHYFSKPDGKEITPVTENNYKSIEIRMIFWKSTLKLFADRPLHGTGRGNWKIAVGEYATSLLPDRLTHHNAYSHCHNDFLQQLAETGIIGFLLFMIPLLAILGLGYRSLVMNSYSFESLIFTIGLTSFLIFALFDFPYQNVEHRILFYFMLLLLYQWLVNDGIIVERKVFSVHKNLILFLIILVSMISLIQVRSDFHTLKAVQLEANDQYSEAHEHLRKANNCFYHITPTNFPLDYIKGRMYILTGNYDRALPLLESAVKINPFEFRALNDFGMLLHASGRAEESLNAFQKSLDIAPYFDEPRYNMAAVYYFKQNYEKALDILEPLADCQKKRDFSAQIRAEMENN